MSKLSLILPCVLSLSLISPVFAAKKGVYGVDDRLEVSQSHEIPLVKAAKSVAGMVDAMSLIDNGDGYYKFYAGTLVDEGWSSDTKFSSQKTLPVCTGFLIAPNLMMTAAHCVTDIDKIMLSRNVFVFDYDAETASQGKIKKDNVVNIVRIADRVFDFRTGLDYAIVEIDGNEATNKRAPLKISNAYPYVTQDLAMIGHPLGLPLKITTGAQVKDIDEYFFTSTLDAFHGNSGSPVLNRKTGQVLGILVRGNDDEIFNSANGKKETAVYDEFMKDAETSVLIGATTAREMIANYASDTELRKRVVDGDVNGALELIKNGADINEEKFGVSLLHESILNDDFEMFEMLINNGINVNGKENAYGYSPLNLALYLYASDFAEVLINQQNIDLNLVDKTLNTPLMHAINNRDSELAIKIINLGADLTVVNEDYKTALVLAHENCLNDVIELIESRLEEK